MLGETKDTKPTSVTIFKYNFVLDVPLQVKSTKRSHILKKKALTTSLFDTVAKSKDERGKLILFLFIFYINVR